MPFDSETLSLVSEVARVGMEALTKEKIRSLWEDPTFPGHGLGLISFKHELESRYGEKLSDKYLKNILIEIPSYLQNIIRKKKIDRRNYDSVHGFLELLQMDFAEFPTFHGYNFAFCVIDCYTSYLWTTVTKQKNAEVVKQELQKIFSQYGTPQVLECDEAGEFHKLQNTGFFRDEKVLLRFKYPPNKAPFIGKSCANNIIIFYMDNLKIIPENAIFQIKRKLYLELRRSGSKNWPRLVQQITYNFNARYRSIILFLTKPHIDIIKHV